MPTNYTLSEQAVKKVAAAVKYVDGQNVDASGTRSLKRSYNSRGFWARIDCYCSFGPNRYKYGWAEVERNSSDQWTNVEDGRYGDCCNNSTTYALNAVEASNTASGIQGDSQTVSSTLFLLPVQGAPIVWMMMSFPQVGSGDTRPPAYAFAFENATSTTAPGGSTCCPGSGSSTSSGSGNYYCVFAFASQYSCTTHTWGAPVKSGVNCMSPAGLVLNQWVQATQNSTTAHYFTLGPSCPGYELTHGCGPFPPAPTTLPMTTPSCGSSHSGSAGQFTCYFGYSSIYDCVRKAWGPVQRVGVNCQPTNSIATGLWMSNAGSLISHYYIAGPSCPAAEKTGNCGAFPPNPSSAPPFTPVCPSTSSGSSVGSGSASSGKSSGGSSGGSGGGSGGGGGGRSVTNVSLSGCTLVVTYSDGSSSSSSVPCCCGSGGGGGGGGGSTGSTGSSVGSGGGSGSLPSTGSIGSGSAGSGSSASSGSGGTQCWYYYSSVWSCASSSWGSFTGPSFAGCTTTPTGPDGNPATGGWTMDPSTAGPTQCTYVCYVASGSCAPGNEGLCSSSSAPALPAGGCPSCPSTGSSAGSSGSSASSASSQSSNGSGSGGSVSSPSLPSLPSGSGSSGSGSSSGMKTAWVGPPVPVARPRFVPGVTPEARG